MRRFIFRFARWAFVILWLFLEMLTAKSAGRKCFKVADKATTIKELDYAYDETNSLPTCSNFVKPGQAKYLTLEHSCETGGVELGWTVGHGRHWLGGYLLKVQKDVDGPAHIIDYHLVTVRAPQRHETFRYRCFNLTSSTYKLSVTIWPLSKELEKCGEKAHVHLVTKKDVLRLQCEAPLCVCQSSVSIKSSVNYDRGSILGVISITKLPTGTKVVVQLQRNGTVHQTWTMRWKAGQVEATVEAKHVTPGQYIFKVHRLCEKHIITMSVCSMDTPPVILSNTITVDNAIATPAHGRPTKVKVGFRRREKNKKDYETEIPSKANIDYLWLMLICVCGIVLVLAAVASWIIYRRGQSLRHRRFATARTIHEQLLAADKRRKVAIIFAKDSKPHTRRVYKLQSDLTKHGVNAMVVDETTNRAIRENWIDEGENVPNRFDVLLFIMSPILYELCNRNQNGLVELADQGHVVHRLPAAILHALSIRPYYADGKTPKVFVVSLDKTSKESNPTIKAFLAEHRGICYPKPVFLMEKGVQKLANKIKSQSLITG